MTVDNIYTILLAGISVALFLFLLRVLRSALPMIRRLLAKLVGKLKIVTLEHGKQGPTAALMLYQERVVEGLSQSRSLGILETFSPEKYISRELELRHAGAESVIYAKPEELLRMHSRLVILGPPGSGKTTTLHHIEFLAAKGLPGIPDLPIFIPVVQLVQFATTFEDIVSQIMRNRYRIFLPREQWVSRLEAGLMLILLDGLDEVGLESEAYQTAVEQIRILIQRFPANPVILTCRTSAWTTRLPEFRETALPPLDQEEIRRYIVAQFQPNSTEQVEGLFDSIHRIPSLSKLAKSPLFLSLMVQLYAKNMNLPKSRSELYQKCTDLLLYEWDKQRRVERPTQIPRPLKIKVLKRLGLLLQKRQIPIISKDELTEQVAEWFPPNLYGSPKLIISEIETAHGLLTRKDTDSYEFPHIVFQQYFAASELTEMKPLPEYLYQNLYNQGWKEVVLLLCGMEHADELIERILDEVKRNRTDSKERYSKLLFSAECLRDGRFVNVDLRRKVVHELQNMFAGDDADITYQAAMALVGLEQQKTRNFFEQALSSLSTPSPRVAAALALAELDEPKPEIANILVESLDDTHLETRIRAARALGQLGLQHVLEPLLAAFERDTSAQARAEMLRAISRIARDPNVELPTGTMMILRAARQDPDPMTSELAAEIHDRLSSRVQE